MREGINPQDIQWGLKKQTIRKAELIELIERVNSLEKRLEKLEKKPVRQRAKEAV